MNKLIPYQNLDGSPATSYFKNISKNNGIKIRVYDRDNTSYWL